MVEKKDIRNRCSVVSPLLGCNTHRISLKKPNIEGDDVEASKMVAIL